MLEGPAGPAFFKGAERELARLHQLVHETVYGPGVDELPLALRPLARLRVTLGYLYRGDIEIAREAGPLLARPRRRIPAADERGQVDERPLDEMRHEAGIGAVIDHGGRGVGPQLRGQVQDLGADGVVRALVEFQHRVVEHAGPRLYRGVDIEGAPLRAEPNQVDAGDVYGQVQYQVAGADEFLQYRAEVAGRQVAVDELRPAPLRESPPGFVGRQDGHPVVDPLKMPADDGQDGPPDASAADHGDAPLEGRGRLRFGRRWSHYGPRERRAGGSAACGGRPARAGTGPGHAGRGAYFARPISSSTSPAPSA